MFCTVLRQFEAEVGSVYYGLLDAFYLVAEHDGVFCIGFWGECVEHCGAGGLFCCGNCVSFGAEAGNGLQGVVVLRPFYAELGSECRFVDFGIGGGGGDAAEYEFFDAVGVGGAEDRPDVEQAAYVVEHHYQRYFGRAVKLFGCNAVDFFGLEFAHNRCAMIGEKKRIAV